uniref:Aminotransferase-like plant mobile domain-containing protein n=1 Tax=Fagus sylvatica TaxID=28930 RepID=A0A2N9FCT9_FAGSY
MASSSKKPAKGCGGSSFDKGGSSIAGGARTLRGSGDNGSSSDSVLGSPEPHGDILGRPIVDPWYRSGERFPSVPASLQPPPADWEWNEMLAVPLVFDFQCLRAIEWADWIDSELADRGFCDRLEQAGVLRSILISRCSNMYRDTEALRQLVRRWCPSTHTFFFAHGELTVTLEDVENHWLLPILGDQDPADFVLSPEEAAFVAYWLSKCVFGEHPAYSIKHLYFPLAVKIAAGVCFPFAPLLLRQLYTQLDMLHAEELVGASCHIVTTALNSSIVHTFLWEHALEYIKKGRKPYEARNKFAPIPEAVAANVGDFQGDVPVVFRWVGNKFYDHSLIPSLDSKSKVCWRPYGVTYCGFSYESVMAGFRNIEAQDYTLIVGDIGSLSYLSATNAGWLPILSSGGLQFTVYSAHRVRRQFGFDQEVPAVMGIAAGEIPVINPFLKARAFAYWSGIAHRVIVPSDSRVGIYTTGMHNYWRGLMAAMVEFRNSGRRDISHLLESYTSPLPHPRLFGATNTMTTYANRKSLGYAMWHHEDSRWVIYGDHHPPLWLRDHPHVAAPRKVPSRRGKRNASASTPTAKEKQPSKSKKREAPSKDSPAQASKRKKTTAGRVGREVLVPKAAVQDPLPARESAAQGVSAPVHKKPVRKTRAEKKTFIPPAFPIASTSIAARVAARKSAHGIVYSERRSKQRANTVAHVPIEIPDDLSSSSSLSDKDNPSGAAAEEVESEDTETAAAETVSGADDFAAEASSANEGTVSSTSSGARTSAEEDEVSMDELEAAEAAFDSDSTASASRLESAEGAVEEHAIVGVVTGVEKVVETTPIAITSSDGTAQGGPSGSGSHMDPLLLDSSPSTRQYVRRARRGSLVSTDSERTASASARVATPPSPLPESGGTVPGPAHVPDIPEGNNLVEGILIDENPVIDAGFDAGVTQVEHAEVAASEELVQADVTPDSDVPVIEEELAQDPVDDIDMANAHDSYDEVLAETEDHTVGAQAADIEVTAPVTAHASPTKTAGSGNEAVAEEERIHQTAAVESAIREFEFDRTSFSSRHAENFWTLDDVRVDFEIFRVLQGGIRFLQALWERYGSCSSYFRRGVHVGSSMLTLLCCVLARMEHTRLEDITEVHILEWKAVDLASARRASAEPNVGSALHDLLA